MQRDWPVGKAKAVQFTDSDKIVSTITHRYEARAEI
jgi:hypothetical protein